MKSLMDFVWISMEQSERSGMGEGALLDGERVMLRCQVEKVGVNPMMLMLSF